MNILYLYNSSQTYTNTVFDHLAALSTLSESRAFFMHVDLHSRATVDMSRFDAVCVHYSVRLPFDDISPAVSSSLQAFVGLKFLFIQDEYDHTHRAWHWIKLIGFHLVFTVVPQPGIERIYPPEEFPGTRFVTNLTGYVPPFVPDPGSILPPSQRTLVIGYRGRPLPLRYGGLGFEKVAIGKMVREYCDRRGIANDVAWTEEARIYGPAWTDFMRSCRAMLGSESGSNVFDWDGSLQARMDAYAQRHPHAAASEIYEQIVKPIELDGVMNQISPRIFEAIAARTVLVLFEGTYSGVVQPDVHFIPLKKDGSNLDEVFSKLEDSNYVDSMADRAYQHVIGGCEFSYPAFVAMVDREVEWSYRELKASGRLDAAVHAQSSQVQDVPVSITMYPIRASVCSAKPRLLPSLEWDTGVLKICVPVTLMWSRVPDPVRVALGPMARFAKSTLVPRGQ
jgi:hypothetical protein